MKLKWEFDTRDIKKVQQFIHENDNCFVRAVHKRNVVRKGIIINKDQIIKTLIMCLVTSQQASGPNSRVGIFMRAKPFPMDYITIKQSRNIEKHIQTIMAQYDLTRYINRIPAYFKFNWDYLEYTDWSLIKELKGMLNGSHGKPEEREVANKIDVIFKGIGPKQSRNFLQTLGLTKYEVPIDSRITAWLNEFGFPIQLTASSLQDLAFYELVLDGFQELCAKASVYPCILDAAIFSSFDKGQWTQQNSIY